MVIFPNNYFWLGKNHQQFVLDPEVLFKDGESLASEGLHRVVHNHLENVLEEVGVAAELEQHPVLAVDGKPSNQAVCQGKGLVQAQVV